LETVSTVMTYVTNQGVESSPGVTPSYSDLPSPFWEKGRGMRA